MYALLIRLSGEFGWNQIRRRSSEGIVYLVSPSRLITDLGSFLNLNLYRVRESFFYISSPFSRAAPRLYSRLLLTLLLGNWLITAYSAWGLLRYRSLQSLFVSFY